MNTDHIPNVRGTPDTKREPREFIAQDRCYVLKKDTDALRTARGCGSEVRGEISSG
jgi:hypothetical protein